MNIEPQVKKFIKHRFPFFVDLYRDIKVKVECDEKYWNKKVKEKDVVYHLGNFAWSPTTAEDYLKVLNGKIYLILGEYDDAAKSVAKHFPKKLYMLPKDIIKDESLKCVFSHYPLHKWPGKENNIFHFHGNTLKDFKTDLNIMNRVNACTDNWNFTPQPIVETLEMLKNFEKKQ